MCVLIFCTTFVWNISHSKKKWARCDQNCKLVYTWSAVYCCRIAMRPEISRQILDKCQISWKSVQWEQNCSMTKLMVAFRNFANAPYSLLGHGIHNLHFCCLGCCALWQPAFLLFVSPYMSRTCRRPPDRQVALRFIVAQLRPRVLYYCSVVIILLKCIALC